MSLLDKSEVEWPPRGWIQLDKIKKLSAHILVKDPVFGRISGLSYKIQSTPVISKKKKNKFLYHFQIDGWEYDINNTSREFPILSFDVKEKIHEQKNCFLLLNIRSSGRPLKTTQIISHRVLSAALHFIREIDNGNAPDFRNTLLLYKVHPSQKELYSHREDDKALSGIIRNFFNNADNNNAAQ